MKEVKALHAEAMEIAEQAHLAKLRAEYELSRELSEKAFYLELRAATRVLGKHKLEPTRSVLARSAASLALDCGQYREAERIIAAALAGEPPVEIATELRDLLEQVYFLRHLSLRGTTLFPEEFQFSMWGSATGAGIAQSDELIARAQKVESLVYRMAERKLEQPYRDSGRRKKELKRKVDLYVSEGKAASYALTFRIGASGEPSFPEMSFAKDIVDELLHCIDLLNRAEIELVREIIPDQAYFNNFVALVRDIAPDGEDIKGVGFTASRDGGKVQVVLSTPKRKLHVPPKIVATPEEEAVPIIVRGILKFADSLTKKQNTIKLEEEGGAVHSIEVPPGLMADIVRPKWGEEVEIVGTKKGDLIVLQSIDPVIEKE